MPQLRRTWFHSSIRPVEAAMVTQFAEGERG